MLPLYEVETVSGALGVSRSGSAYDPVKRVHAPKAFGVKSENLRRIASEAAAEAVLASAAASMIGRGISQILVGWIPGLGNAINASTAAGLTEAIGWILANDFDEQSSGKR